MPDLSIVLPTCDRAGLLDAALGAIVDGTRCAFEVIVVDGASTDDTPAVLSRWQRRLGRRLTVFREPERRGFVRAANLGLRAARGRNVCWINDDARPLPGALDLAVAQLDAAPPQVGLLALFHRWHSPRNVAFETAVDGRTFSLCHVRGTLYANFPIGRRTTFERLNYLDERFRFCAADPDLSLAAWHAGLSVEPAWDSCIDHDEFADDRRAVDGPAMAEDNAKLFEKWDLPEKTPTHNDFDPARPCTLRGLRSLSRAA